MGTGWKVVLMADLNQQALSELVSAIKLANQNLSAAIVQLNATLGLVLPRVFGSFTLAAAATTTVTNSKVAANSIIVLMPTNAAAGTLMGSAKSLYISARSAGVSFTVATAAGTNAAGSETFDYQIINPV